MPFVLRFTKEAVRTLEDLKRRDERKYRKVGRCLVKIAADPRSPGLNSHLIRSMTCPEGRPVWESYVENNTPGAWRVFWCYGPDEPEVPIITVIAITPHL